jgi:hypothetical protein
MIESRSVNAREAYKSGQVSRITGNHASPYRTVEREAIYWLLGYQDLPRTDPLIIELKEQISVYHNRTVSAEAKVARMEAGMSEDSYMQAKVDRAMNEVAAISLAGEEDKAEVKRLQGVIDELSAKVNKMTKKMKRAA